MVGRCDTVRLDALASSVVTAGRSGEVMISAAECSEHAVECRQMSERAPSLRVRDILIDMARAWERLALETEHNVPATPKYVLRHQVRRLTAKVRFRRVMGWSGRARATPVII